MPNNESKSSKRKRSVSPPPLIPAASKRKRHAESCPSRKELVARVFAFVEKHGAIQQGTPRWHDLMQMTLGGSEMSVLLGMNRYMK